jgi:hypothetical protein
MNSKTLFLFYTVLIIFMVTSEFTLTVFPFGIVIENGYMGATGSILFIQLCDLTGITNRH